ncbi:MAG: hypothetical protein AB9917_01325 [Negativicutes bacterium]
MSFKKCIIVILAGLVFLWAAPAFTEAAPSKTVIYYWGNGCPACKEVAPAIDRIVDNGIPVEKYEIYDNRANADHLTMSFKMYGIPEAEWAIPVAFYNGRMYMGVSRIMELEKELSDVQN